MLPIPTPSVDPQESATGLAFFARRSWQKFFAGENVVTAQTQLGLYSEQQRAFDLLFQVYCVSLICNYLVSLLPHKVKTQYVAHTAFSKFWDMEHFAHTAFLLSVKFSCICEQRVSCLLIIILMKKCFNWPWIYPAVDDIVLLMHFAHTAFLLCQTIFS